MNKIKYLGKCRSCDWVVAASANEGVTKECESALQIVFAQSSMHSRIDRSHVVDLQQVDVKNERVEQ